MLLPRTIAFLGATLLLVPLSAAQDAHYWTNQYGTRAELLGGTVVGTIKDLSATFYNPGALALSPDPQVALSTDALELTFINMENGAGQDIDLRTLNGRTPPNITALQFPSKENRHWAISILTRHDFRFDTDGRRIISTPAPSGTGPDHIAGELFWTQELLESWGGVTWARPLSKKVAFGITQYLALRLHNRRFQLLGQSASDLGTGVTSLAFDGFRYFNVRTLWKVGLGFKFTPITFGLTMTTPSINLFGEGRVQKNASRITNGDNPTTELISNGQQELDAVYKSPFSVAVGLAYYVGQTEIYVSAEWFNAVKRFVVLDAKPFQGQTTGETISAQLTHELDAVLNVGVGIEHALTDNFEIYASVITDHSAKNPTSDTKLSLSSWDIWHMTAGSAFSFRRIDFTLGLAFSYGQDKGAQFVNFPNDFKDPPFFLSPEEQTVTYLRFRLLFGFSLRL